MEAAMSLTLFPRTNRAAMRRLPRAFTLVELLIVIIIIGLLMALLVPAIMGVRIKARDAQIVAEIAELDKAMQQFKDKHGAYPPAMHYDDNGTATAGGTVENRVRAFWRRAWPRWSNTSTNVAQLDPAEVLVFYLGGIPSTSGSTKVTGFNLNPLNPTATGGQRSTPLFQFDQGRLFDEDDDTFWEYYPPQKRSKGDGITPYVYFDFTSYVFHSSGSYWFYHATNATPAGPQPVGSGPFVLLSSTNAFPTSTAGTATPYYDSAVSGGFMNPTSFQIISAGLDNNYGSGTRRGFPSGAAVAPSTTGYNTEDYDNLTNFTTSRLEEAIP
jgi:general secretion pathway protein G